MSHRWLGIVTCLLCAMWFASGLVMLYVPFPNLEREERLAGLERIAWDSAALGPGEALRAAGIDTFPKSLVLEMRSGEPVWRIGDRSVSAVTGRAVGPADAAEARRIAEAFLGRPAARVEAVTHDQWTVAGSFDGHRPLHKVVFGDKAGDELYISSTTGAVVLDTNRGERFWNWLGSVPHWLYPTILRQNQPLWRQVVLWTSGVTIVGSVTGIWIGILRMRLGRRRYKSGRVSPYRGWQWWHHVIGLAGGTFLATWIVSGWLSVDPNRWFASPGLSVEARAAYAGAGTLPPMAMRELSPLRNVRRMRVVWANREPLLVLEQPGRDPVVLSAWNLRPPSLMGEQLAAGARRLMPGVRVRGIRWITEPDAYWYKPHGLPELPVLRVVFDDPQRTWVHISLRSGEVLGSMDTRRRVYRWLFDALHCWDINGLITRRPAWDIWMWLWSIAGLVISVSGIVIGWRRLVR